MSSTYNWSNIRELLSEGFSAEQLRTFCHDHASFRPVHDQLNDQTGKGRIVTLLLEYVDRHLLVDELLAWVEQTNSRRYEIHQPYVINSTNETSTQPYSVSDPSSEADTSIIVEPRVGSGNGLSGYSNHPRDRIEPIERDRITELAYSRRNAEKVSPLSQFVANLLLLVILIFILNERLPVNCVPGQINTFFSAVIALVVFHAVWRLVGPLLFEILDGKVNLFGLQIELKSFVRLLDLLHPRRLPAYIFWGGFTILISSAYALGYSNFSPFVLKESTPIIRGFTIIYPDEREIKVSQHSGTVRIAPYEQILVKARVSQQSAFSCRWSAINGQVDDDQNCTTLYTPAFNAKNDTLVVRTQSMCQLKQSSAGIHINVIQTESP